MKMENECARWLNEVRDIFPKLRKKIILANYKKISKKSLGYVKTKIEERINFNPEALILGKEQKIKKNKLKPKEFYIYINKRLQRIKKNDLRKEVVQFIMIHELLHIEQEDLITLSKQYSRRKKKKIHVNDFENLVFERYNKLRELKNMPKIKEKQHLDIAVSKILKSIDFYD